jgi:hypothetical protein
MTVTQQPNLLMGQRKANAHLIDMRPDDAFSETVIFGVACKTESEYVKAWPITTTLAGLFKGWKTMALKAGEDTPQSYIKMEGLDGVKFRAYAPAQLLNRVEQIPLGTYLEITYKGKEEATLKDGAVRNVHAFDVRAELPAATH